ncbi:MAG TPA: NTP transferase domain-containing protein [Lacipirellulaceae bacterium]|jgi:bifunctional UDP-N-acetylglucosamine pyrophosphorylase/glucosamine-1-phosphate N-acetyltransferase/UDP-N-acetylglucosamine pyrophosphorylase
MPTGENGVFVTRWSEPSSGDPRALAIHLFVHMPPDPLAIVLAAGKGKRMASDLPKVLVPVCGRPMIRFVVDAARTAGVDRMVVVVGYRSALVRNELTGEPGVSFVEQTEQLGTGHAVMMCRDQLIGHDGPVLILAGDSPMVQVSSLRAVLSAFAAQQPACLLGTATKPDPAGLGRIVRSANGEFLAIVEEKDATPAQRAITEVNMSNYVFQGADLLWALGQLTAENAQGEYYLTDCPGVLKRAGRQVVAVNALQPCEALSINTVEELAVVEREMKRMNIRCP